MTLGLLLGYMEDTQPVSHTPGHLGAKRLGDMHAQMTGAASYRGVERAISFKYICLYVEFEVTVGCTL